MKKIDEIIALICDRDISSNTKGIILAGNVKCLNAFICPRFLLMDDLSWPDYATVLSRKTDAELFPYLFDCVSWSIDADFYSPDGVIIAHRIWRMERTESFNSTLKKLRKLYIEIKDDESVWAVDHFLNGEKFLCFDPEDEPVENRPEFNQIIPEMNEPCDIDIAVEMLNSDNPEDVQEQGRTIARSIKSIYCFSDVLVHPEQEKSRLNLAKILCEHPDEDLKHGKLLYPWIEDMDKPYAKICFDRLVQMKPDDDLDKWHLEIWNDDPDRMKLSPVHEELRRIRREKLISEQECR